MIEDFEDVTPESVEKLLTEKYGFTKVDEEEFNDSLPRFRKRVYYEECAETSARPFIADTYLEITCLWSEWNPTFKMEKVRVVTRRFTEVPFQDTLINYVGRAIEESSSYQWAKEQEEKNRLTEILIENNLEALMRS